MLHRLRNTLSLLPMACTIGLLAMNGIVSHAALADQTAPELPGLFEQLRQASDEGDARAIESRIWQHWMTAPDEPSEWLMSQITLAMAAEELSIALALCDELVESRPDFAEGWNRRATLHYMMGDSDSSVADIRETLVREPRHFGAISGLGLIFMRQNDFDAALDAFEQVLIISPASASARMNIDYIRNEAGTRI